MQVRVWSKIPSESAVCVQALQIDAIPDELDAYFKEIVLIGESSPSFIRGICGNLVENGHVERTAEDSVKATRNLHGLENGLTRLQALGRGDFDNKLMIHVQMLAKVVCFLSHNSLFSVDLARHVYSGSFPNFAQDFEGGIAKLIELGVIQRTSSDEVFAVLVKRTDDCQECKHWEWQVWLPID